MKKKNINIDWETLILRSFLHISLTVFALAFFLPDENGMRNLPLLYTIVCILLLSYIIPTVRKIFLLVKTRKLLFENGVKRINTYFNPFASRLKGDYSLTFKYNGKEYSMKILLRKNAWTRCHFDSEERIEYYKTTRALVKRNKVWGRFVRGGASTRCVGKQSIKWHDVNEKTVRLALFNKMPAGISSSFVREPIDAGMSVMDRMYVFDFLYFKGKFNYILTN